MAALSKKEHGRARHISTSKPSTAYQGKGGKARQRSAVQCSARRGGSRKTVHFFYSTRKGNASQGVAKQYS